MIGKWFVARVRQYESNDGVLIAKAARETPTRVYYGEEHTPPHRSRPIQASVEKRDLIIFGTDEITAKTVHAIYAEAYREMRNAREALHRRLVMLQASRDGRARLTLDNIQEGELGPAAPKKSDGGG